MRAEDILPHVSETPGCPVRSCAEDELLPPLSLHEEAKPLTVVTATGVTKTFNIRQPFKVYFSPSAWRCPMAILRTHSPACEANGQGGLPAQAIRSPENMSRFQEGEAFRIVKEFILSLNDTCVGKTIQDVKEVSPQCQVYPRPASEPRSPTHPRFLPFDVGARGSVGRRGPGDVRPSNPRRRFRPSSTC